MMVEILTNIVVQALWMAEFGRWGHLASEFCRRIVEKLLCSQKFGVVR